LEIKIATDRLTQQVLSFFQKYIDHTTEGIYNLELVCPDGIRAAVKRQQIIVAMEPGAIVAALRFYKRKNHEIASLYQYAISEAHRGKGILTQMFKILDTPLIVAKCPENSCFNEYYMKTGWHLLKIERNLVTWQLANHTEVPPGCTLFSIAHEIRTNY